MVYVFRVKQHLYFMEGDKSGKIQNTIARPRKLLSSNKIMTPFLKDYLFDYNF